MRPSPGGRERNGGSAPGTRASEASRFGTWLPGLPAPDPGHFFLGEKVTKTPPGTPRTPVFSNRSVLDLILRCH